MDFIFYGLFLLMLDINVDSFDLLPDFIGFYLMYRGLKELETESRHFADIKPWTIAMGVYSAIRFVASLVGGTPGEFGTVPVSTGTTIIYLFVLYRIVQGVQDLESKFAVQMEGTLLMRRWKHVCIVQAAIYFLSFISVIKPLRSGIVVSVLALVSFVLYILFLMAFHRSRQAYYAVDRTPRTEPAAEAACTRYQEPEQSPESSESSASAEPSEPTE